MLTRAQVRAVDRLAVERFLVPSIVLMENAARQAAQIAWEMIGKTPGRLVDIVCGPGNNGGDGLAIARHLHNWGAWVNVIPAQPPQKWTGDAHVNWRIVRCMQMDVARPEEIGAVAQSNADLIVDALLGTGVTDAPRDEPARLIEAMNASGRPILAIDLPSGLDCDKGVPLGSLCVKAVRTVTFVAPKAGFANPESEQYTGEVVVADIGCPNEAIEMARNEVKS